LGDQVLEDMVRVIRGFRPNLVINGWGGVHAGHGHHQALGIAHAEGCATRSGFFVSSCAAPPRKKGLTPWGDRKPVVG